MSEILFLAHRIPYPPDKGDKIRSYHLLRALVEQHTVHLGTFVDDPADWEHARTVESMCGETCIRPLDPRMGKLRSGRGLVSGEPLTMSYYRDQTLHAWSREIAVRRPLAGVLAFSSSMGQYAVRLPSRTGTVRVMDFCDVDSDKWRQYAASHGFPLRQVYAREARLLASTERRYLQEFDACLVVSDAEARLLEASAGGASDRIRVVPNGVDTGYFDPTLDHADPYAPGTRPLVFTGAMDYHANVDAVRWFATEVLPAVRQRVQDAVFTIVGSNPAPEVRALARDSAVVVTGRVPDVRPYLAHAAVVVAPLRIARGVQNKVLEALAMARPVVATENALQGIPSAQEAGIIVAFDPATMTLAVVDRLEQGADAPQGRRFVSERFGWSAQLAPVMSLFESRA